MLRTYTVQTGKEEEMINIDHLLRKAIAETGVVRGAAVIYCPHTTAAITINENGDPDVKRDVLFQLGEISPKRKEFHHFEGNSHAHVKSSLVGCSEIVMIEDGAPVLGTWQSVYFCEFDGPRTRKCHIKIIEDAR